MARYDPDVRPYLGSTPPWRGDRPVLGEVRSRGRDPNYRGGVYRGERMQPSQEGQAPYGHYRQRHAGDLQGYGGREGRYPGYGSDYDRGYRSGPGARGGYDRPYQGRSPGGVRGDVSYLRDFNKNSPALREESGRARRTSNLADDSVRRTGPRTDASRALGYDDGFNRYGGRSSAGFSEYWLPKQAPRGQPMRHWGGK